MTPEGRLCVRTFKGKGIMNLHKHFQNESEFVTQDQVPLFHKNGVESVQL